MIFQNYCGTRFIINLTHKLLAHKQYNIAHIHIIKYINIYEKIHFISCNNLIHLNETHYNNTFKQHAV